MDTSPQKHSWPIRWLARPLRWLFPDLTTDQLANLVSKFNIANLLFCYCIPFFYVFYPTLLMPAIFLRSLSFVVGWAHGLVSHHSNSRHKSTPRRPRRPDISRTNTSSDGEMNNMYFWMQRCSICLDQTYALCLESCRDQFCKECFARYVEEIVNTSWGLGVTRIKCPVCRETISKSEWSRYVSADIVERYDRYNQPYRSFSRHCLECETAIIPCQGPRLEKISHEGRLELIGRDLSLLPKNEQVIELEAMFEKARLSKRTLRVGQVQELYGQMAPLLKQAGDYELCSGISKQLVSLETLPEAWKQIQFRHVANFPIERCTTCQRTMCLQCGEFGHGGQSCLEYLETQMTGGSEDQLATVQWKLEHTRPCPNCSIMIDRDEGCNKVDCLLCGFRFCWMCGSKWSQQCGFYQCQQQQPIQQAGSQAEKVELGVPDMAAIDARRH